MTIQPDPRPSPKFFLVCLEDGVPTFQANGVMYAIRLHPGVARVIDMSAISQVTLDAILLAPAPISVERPPRGEQLELSA